MQGRIKRIAKNLLVTLLAAALLLSITAPAAWATLTAKANHDEIKIGYNYNGSTVSISGIADPGVDLILKIAESGPGEKLMRKDKVGGVLWMNVEELDIEQVPAVYFLRSTRPPDEILNGAKLTQYGIGYGALSQNAVIEPQPSPDRKASIFSNFIKLKESKELFDQSVGGIDFKSEGNSDSYYTMFDWPYQAPPGEYEVTAYAVKGGNVIEIAQTNVLVEQVGVVQKLSNMAMEDGALYGAAAVIVAIAAGFGVGMVFRRGGGAH